jgi:hypothetical protein
MRSLSALYETGSFREELHCSCDHWSLSNWRCALARFEAATRIGHTPHRADANKKILMQRYFAKYEFTAPHMLCCSDCEPVSVSRLLSGADAEVKAMCGPLATPQLLCMYVIL